MLRLFEGFVVYADVFGLEVFFFDEGALVFGDVVEQLRDEVGDEGGGGVDDDADGFGVEGLAVECVFEEVEDEACGEGDDEGAEESGAEEFEAAHVASEHAEVEEVEHGEEDEVADDDVFDVECGLEAVCFWRNGAEYHDDGEDDGRAGGEPEGPGGAVGLYAVQCRHVAVQGALFYAVLFFHAAKVRFFFELVSFFCIFS